MAADRPIDPIEQAAYYRFVSNLVNDWQMRFPISHQPPPRCGDESRQLFNYIQMLVTFMSAFSEPDRKRMMDSAGGLVGRPSWRSEAESLYSQITGYLGLCNCMPCKGSRGRGFTNAQLAWAAFEDYIRRWPPRTRNEAIRLANSYIETGLSTPYLYSVKRNEPTR